MIKKKIKLPKYNLPGTWTNRLLEHTVEEQTDYWNTLYKNKQIIGTHCRRTNRLLEHTVEEQTDYWNTL